MLYTVIEMDPKTRKEKVILRTNQKIYADEIIEENPNCFIRYNKKAIAKVSAPVVTKQRELSPIETLPSRRFPNQLTDDQKKAEYEMYNNQSSN